MIYGNKSKKKSSQKTLIKAGFIKCSQLDQLFIFTNPLFVYHQTNNRMSNKIVV